MTSQPLPRDSGRVILIGPGARTLLFRGGDPARPKDGTWWFTPGGGIQAGESPEQAARRELFEESGQADVEWGGLVARRRVVFEFMGQTYRAEESYYLAHTQSLEVDLSRHTALETRTVEEHRWLTATDIEHLPEPVYPPKLSRVLDDLARHRLPKSPWSWEG